MNATFTINMYSGMAPPQKELTQEQQDKIMELTDQLDIPCFSASPLALASLSPTHYLVMWNEGLSHPDVSLTGVRVQAFGCVEVWRGSQSAFYKDTVGLWSYLATIGAPLLQLHLEGNA